jgi:predicted TIM-barrel fold metal-dependent hydrolase
MSAFSCDGGIVAACTCHPSRRQVLMGGAALGLAAGVRRAAAQSAPAAERIDVHHHLVPPGYVAAVSTKAPVSPPIQHWSLQKTIDDMGQAGVGKAMLSVTTPGLWFGDVSFAAPLARSCNEYGAKLMADPSGRFGYFAALPLPDVDASLKEIAYAYDVLHTDGIAMFTSYGDKWLGDPAFAPVFEELNRRQAVVFTHPTTAQCCGNLIPFIPDPAIEFGTDTTRTIASLVFSGAAARYPDVRFVFSHAGGTMPFLIERFQFIARDPAMQAKTGIGLLPLLQRFYYDTAQASNPIAMTALRTLVPNSQILFGTDFPFRTAAEHVKGLAACGFTAAEMAGINRDNAERLLARG